MAPAEPSKDTEVRTSALAADAPSIVSALKARAGSPVGASAATGFDAVAGGGLKPRFTAADVAAERAPARVTLPAAANAPLHLEDAATGTAVDVTLQGAAASAGQTTEGYVVYPAATAAGASLVQRAVAAGTEDFIAMDAKPAATQVAYTLSLGVSAAALRLVGGTLEVLDAGGAPRLRVAPPYIVGADGVTTDATLAVAGCAVDTSPAPPWGRAVTAPGAKTCTVRVTWPSSGVAYPAILDPRWTTTGSMATQRYEHTLTLIASTGKVLAAGGRSSTSSKTALNTAEIYDKATGTWGSAGTFSGARRLHTATQLPTSSNSTTSGKILIAGGINGTTTLATAQLYDPSAGTWATAAPLNAARHLHTENLLPDGRVLVSGGMNGTTTVATAALYNPASGSGSWAATIGPIPPTGWRFGTATLIQTTNTQLNNHVLLVGGNNGTATLSSVYLFDPVQNAFSTLASLSSGPREQHTASVLPNSNGKILVTGGKNGSTVLNTALIFDPGFSNGSWSAAGTMTAARYGHTATVLPTSIVADGSVLVEGGNNGSATLSSAELFSGTSTWTATPAMPAAVQNHCAVLLGNNMVLIAGGLSNSTTVTGATRLYDASFGLGCSSGSQCPSGFCVDGVCCDVACGNGAANDCQACNLAGHLGTCTARPSGTSCRPSAGQCDVAETCNGSSFNCPTDAFVSSSTPCRNAVDVCDQAENCTGNSATCPADAKKPSGTACADDGNVCTTDTCNGTLNTCQHAPGNAGTQCRAAAGVCDLPATCSGSSVTCPANPFKSSSTVCRSVAGECDVVENCTGSSASCPADVKKQSGTACTDDNNVCTTDTCNGTSAVCQHPAGNTGTVCRAAADLCDVAENCTGSSATCPANGFKPSSTVCRGSAGICDVAENCTGSAAACPSNSFAPPSTVCRAAAGQCDVAETCTGSSAGCPGDAFAPSSTVCRAAAGQCDVAETCTGSSANCPADALASNGTACNDGNNCTAPDVCTSGTCAGTPLSSCGLTAPPLDRTVATDFFAATSFLYTGSNPIQTGVGAGTIEFVRASVIRGLVTDRAGAPVLGVTIKVHGHSEFGQTSTRADGMFDIAVNGGGLLTVEYSKSGFLSSQRPVTTPKRDYVWAADVVMVPIDPEMTIVNLPSGTMQLAQGSVVTDVDGSRQATLLIPENTTADMVLPDGTTSPMAQMSVRASEFTVGATGQKAMPAPLPPTSGYTYAVELSADEAIGAGATRVVFNHPVIQYLDNYRGFPSGGIVPVGFYDRDLSAWIPSANGRVIKIVEIFGGFAEIDTNGDEVADDAATLDALGVTDSERAQLASLYLPGATLWRIPVPHFSVCDYNWPIVPPERARPAKAEIETPPQRDPNPCDKNGSVIHCENQVLGESIPITGTPFKLEYSSDRVPGFRGPNKFSLTATEEELPEGLQRVDVSIAIAGQFRQYSVPVTADQKIDFEWDGTDGYGRATQGPQTAKVFVTYAYPGTYTTPAAAQAYAFGFSSSSNVDVGAHPGVVSMTTSNQVTLTRWDFGPKEGLGGWALSPHHAYSVDRRQLLTGAGAQIDAGAVNDTVTRVGGIGTWSGGSGDGGPARAAAMFPLSLAVAPDGSIYFYDIQNIRKIAPDGTVTTVAGGGFRSTESSPDDIHSYAEGFPATEADLHCCEGFPDLALGPDGSVYFTSGASTNFVLRIGTDGILTRVLGSWMQVAPPGNLEGFNATDPSLGDVRVAYLAVASDGALYWTDNTRIYRVAPNGLIERVAGTGVLGDTPDGLPARDNPILVNHNQILVNHSLALGRDGSVYFVQGPLVNSAAERVRRIGPDGILRTVAGNGIGVGGTQGGFSCVAPVDGPALGVGGNIHSLTALAIGPDDSIYLSDACGGAVGLPHDSPFMAVIRKLGPDGQLRTIAGGGPTPVTQMSGPSGFPSSFPLGISGFLGGNVADITLARQWPLLVLGGMAVTSDAIYVAGVNGGNRYASAAFLYRVSSGLPGVALGNTTIASEDGSEVFEFDQQGRHLRTLDALTGSTKYLLGYTSQGLLSAITNTDGLATTIERDSTGAATAIVAPNGQRTTLTIGADGYLAQVTNPAGNAVGFTYGAGGLLSTYTDLRGGNHTFTFDGDGLLTRDEGPVGFTQLSRTTGSNTVTVTSTTAEGRQDVYTTAGAVRTTTDPRGLSSTYTTDPTGGTTTVVPNGMVATTNSLPDPQFGSAAEFVSTTIDRTPAGLVSQSTMTRSAVVNGGALVSETDTFKLNGKPTTMVYDASSRTTTTTSPAGRLRTTTKDEHGRTALAQAGTLEPTTYAYDLRGRLASVTAGSGATARVTSFTYDNLDRKITTTDPLTLTSTFGYDNNNRLTSISRSGTTPIVFSYRSGDDLMSVLPPGRSAYTFDYTLAGDPFSYSVPVVGNENPTIGFEYDQDRRLKRVLGPDGQIVYGYEIGTGSLSTTTFPRDTSNPAAGNLMATLGYAPSTGQVTSMSIDDGSQIAYKYDGKLHLSTTWSGAVGGSASRTYNNDFRIDSESVNSANPVAFGYDADGLVTSIGALALTRDAPNGLVTDGTLGNVTDHWAYSAFGELRDYEARYTGASIFHDDYQVRDAVGRIETKVETVQGETATWSYAYDPLGRLSQVMRNGALVATYGYDANGNRTAAPGLTLAPTYDAQDRLLSYGDWTFSYTPGGDLMTKLNTSTGALTRYRYDGTGALRRVELPDGHVIDYMIDPTGRRVGKKVDGVLVRAWLYADDTWIIAELDGTGAVVSRFVRNEYIIRGAATYRLIKDHAGSVRMVVNVDTGAVMQRIDYDEFGKVTSDSAPGFQPLGFAGGLYDSDTGLVRFGARDYDAAIGRWTSKDPIQFKSGDTNLYVYAKNDPINMTDRTGLVIDVSSPSLDAAIQDLASIPELAPFIYDLISSPAHINIGELSPAPRWLLDQGGAGTFPGGGSISIFINMAEVQKYFADCGTPLKFDLQQVLVHELGHAWGLLFGGRGAAWFTSVDFENALRSVLKRKSEYIPCRCGAR